ncbi:GGDEF domain-containing phosphodiesterase [Sporosarcina sp. HYO08]|uniref:sensor domain-containing protein n=1 Tax=Sporosarcina sp. HYO08 TaxID=1759557 RepID=UPI00079448AB|nr:GGDEF domain-containing phosphodiesterase [Sporosarcina sp. HYO08]KXH83886.1 diguanylate cyclase [Sporosarcina sp. HYO08]
MRSAKGRSLPEIPDIIQGLERHYMVTRTDSDGFITDVNKNFLEISKWTPKRVLDKTIWQMFPNSNDESALVHTIWTDVSNGKTWFGAAEKLTRTGESYFVSLLAIPHVVEEQGVTSVTFLELDMTEDIERRKQLQQLAFIDYETGLMSRHKLETTVDEAIAEDRHFSLVHLTIDHYFTLKELQSSDFEIEMIQAFSNRVKRYFQDNPIARIGVNEFIVITPFGDWYVQGFLQFLEQQPISINHSPFPLSVSGGIVRYPEDQISYVHLMKAAVAATKEVTKNGGGKIASLSPASHKILNRKTMIDRKLLTALNDNNLQVVYQPQRDIASGKITLYEALVRWEDEELGYISPDELIPIAEENGLIHEIGQFVLKESAILAASWHEQKHDVGISINTSVREFSNDMMKNKVIGILAAAGCPANLIQIEITEKFAFQAEEENSIQRQMKELQEIGIEFALDDFGTGYASFRYMEHLPLTKVKIDKEFIHSLSTRPRTKQLVEGMIRFGKSMGLYVVAEGVETEEQYDLLTSMGVDAVQGYYIGMPVTADQIDLTNQTY